MLRPTLIIILVALACTCWLTDSGGPPTPMPVGVSGTTETKIGLTRSDDQMISNFSYVNEPKKIGVVTSINARGNANDADLPYGASN